MLRIASLASGSKGNSTVVFDDEDALIVDSGISARRVLESLDSLRIESERVRGIVITHEHRDHCAGVGPLARKLRVPVFATQGTFLGCSGVVKKLPEFRPVQVLEPFAVGGFIVEPFPTYHDAADPFAVVVRSTSGTDHAVAVVTDLGFVSTLAFDKLRGCRALLFESNHDRTMLLEGPYPPLLKQRILGRHGHLDNESSARAITRLFNSGTRRVLLAHLSEVNNSPATVIKTMTEELRPWIDQGLTLDLTFPERPSVVLSCGDED